MKHDKVSIGIDQSYKQTGISIVKNSKIESVQSINLEKYECKAEKRQFFRLILNEELKKLVYEECIPVNHIIVVFERIRQFSKGFISMDYITGMGALNSCIIDVAYTRGIKSYSVDTRCWKSSVVGTCKKEENNFGVPPEKWLTVKWVIEQGWKDSIIKEVTGRREKGTFVSSEGRKLEFDNDAADSCAIAMFPWVGDKNKLKLEK